MYVVEKSIQNTKRVRIVDTFMTPEAVETRRRIGEADTNPIDMFLYTGLEALQHLISELTSKYPHNLMEVNILPNSNLLMLTVREHYVLHDQYE